MNKTLGLLFIVALTACGQANDSTSALNSDGQNADNKATIKEGTFKMYEEARVQPNAFCDVYTSLQLKNTDEGIIADMSNGLDGICELAVFPNLRSYKLTAIETSCGSTIYSGTIIDSANDRAAAEIKVTDHRTRVCRDLVPARIIVEELVSAEHVRTLYSHDMLIPQVKSVSLKGTLFRKYAIGGESTGYGLQLADGQIVELSLGSADLINSFIDGSDVMVSGTYKTIEGVEIAQRKVLVVKSMTAL